jgi:cold shock CspA family protein
MSLIAETSSLGTSLASSRHMGRVKWFNNKAGYGFITVTDGERAGTDIFVHHSGIMVSNEQYKYLVQGEYVEFVLDKTSGGSHDFQAGEVSGINAGKLMCETRRDFKQLRTLNHTTEMNTDAFCSSPPELPPKSVSAPRTRGDGPRATEEWTKPEEVVVSKPRGRPRKQQTLSSGL